MGFMLTYYLKICNDKHKYYDLFAFCFLNCYLVILLELKVQEFFLGLFYSRYLVIFPIENSIFFPNLQENIPN